MKTMERIYNNKDVDMIITIDTIMDSAIANKTILQSKRSNWADPFFQDIKTQIDSVVQQYLGQDSAKALRQSTQIVKGIQAKVLTQLAEVKVQIDQDFKPTQDRRTEILKQLGFKDYYEPARKKDQEGLINLLYQFKANLTAELKTEIANKGTAPAALEEIVEFADTLKNANVTQEGNKGTKKEMTTEGIQALNDIYSKVISIAMISAKFFQKEPTKKALFSYTKVSKALNNAKPKTPKTSIT
jgi:hypothetical protein